MIAKQAGQIIKNTVRANTAPERKIRILLTALALFAFPTNAAIFSRVAVLAPPSARVAKENVSLMLHASASVVVFRESTKLNTFLQSLARALEELGELTNLLISRSTH
jgi:hypothetical protein